MYDYASHQFVPKKRKTMFARARRRLFIAVAAVLLAACATGQPVYNVTKTAAVTNKPNPTADEVRQAIIRAGTQLGWQMRADRPGHLLGTLTLRTHTAVVDIDYDRTAYSIRYKDSTNLDYNGSTIHRSYNGWVQNLDRAIKTQLTAI
jgi:hypothetical protein